MKATYPTHGQWPAGANDAKPAKPVNTCPRPKCGAVYSGTSHVCRNPAKEPR
ncbi:hypothetical protein AB0C10_26940 [Microbispora amethystogenes]|uniref:hypothetical protein n=1 Tax=Microbispora amethystogenes TaxID=1427754 RepID=UPI00340834D3